MPRDWAFHLESAQSPTLKQTQVKLIPQLGSWLGKLAKLVTLSPVPCWDPAAMLRDAGQGLGLAGWDLALGSISQNFCAFIHRKLDKRSKRRQKERGESPSALSLTL